jgi:thymidylate synthase (FAD)
MRMVKSCPACKGSGRKPGDEKLLSYLYNNNHSTPFEMAGAIIEVQAPIFVFREWVRHRTQSFNELSARYTPLPELYYVPTLERCMLNSQTNKQAGLAKGASSLTETNALLFISAIKEAYLDDEALYKQMLEEGVPKELARCIMPVGHYSRMRASVNLRNWLGFLTLRQAPNAQWEIRQYADALNSILVEHFPRTMELFNAD